MKSFELLVRKTNKPIWREPMPPTSSEEEISKWVGRILEKHKDGLQGSFQVITKKDGGYAKNKETGFTIMTNFKGRLELTDLWECISFGEETG